MTEAKREAARKLIDLSGLTHPTPKPVNRANTALNTVSRQNYTAKKVAEKPRTVVVRQTKYVKVKSPTVTKPKKPKKVNPFDAVKAAQRRRTRQQAQANLSNVAGREIDLGRFNKDQPRHPKGSAAGLGGQWADNPASAVAGAAKGKNIIARANQRLKERNAEGTTWQREAREATRVAEVRATLAKKRRAPGLIASIIDASRPPKEDRPELSHREAVKALNDMEAADAEVREWQIAQGGRPGEVHVEGGDTFEMFSSNGEWDAARAEWHNEVVASLLAEAKHTAEANKVSLKGKRMLLLGGLPGAGKSTILTKGKAAHGIDQNEYVTINPDLVKERVSEVWPNRIPKVGNLKPLTRSAIFHEEANHIASLLEERAYAEGLNVAHDYTMSSVKSAEKRIKTARREGYSVHALFVDVPRELSRARATVRFHGGQKEPRGGRPVNLDQYEGALVSTGSRYSANRDTMDTVVQNGWLDGYSVYDHLQARVEHGGDVK